MPLPRLFLVTDRRAAALPVVDAVTRALEAADGLPVALVLREKDLPIRESLALADALRRLTHAYDAQLIVSGRPDVALLSDADGVHLGGEALPCDDVRAFVPEDVLVGVSIHGSEVPPPAASYAFLAPVFETDSKPDATPLGLDALARIVAGTRVPIVALGGIRDAERARACLEAGAAGVAIRGAILGTDDPAAAIGPFVELLR